MVRTIDKEIRLLYFFYYGDGKVSGGRIRMNDLEGFPDKSSVWEIRNSNDV